MMIISSCCLPLYPCHHHRHDRHRHRHKSKRLHIMRIVMILTGFLIIVNLVENSYRLRLLLPTIRTTTSINTIINTSIGTTTTTPVFTVTGHGDNDNCRVAFIPLSDDVFYTPAGFPHNKNSRSSSSHSQVCTSNGQVRLFFIHVGKTGGMSLSTTLDLDKQAQRNYNCLRQQQQKEHITKTKIQSHRSWWLLSSSIRNNEDPCDALDENSHPFHITQHVYGIAHTGLADHWSFEKKEWMDQHTNTLLISVRDPLDRLVSAYYYEQKLPRNMVAALRNKHNITKHVHTMRTKFFEHCFPTFSHLINAIQNYNINTTASSDNDPCEQFAVGVLHGGYKENLKQPQKLGHLYYNYEHYAKRYYDSYGQKQKAIVVIRTNHMWDDVARIEAWLGGDPTRFMTATGTTTGINTDAGTDTETVNFTKSRNNNDNHNLPSSLPQEPQQQQTTPMFWRVTHGSSCHDNITENQADILCRALVRELHVYQEWILAAINLSDEEKKRELRETLKRCGVPSTESLSFVELSRWDWLSYYEQK